MPLPSPIPRLQIKTFGGMSVERDAAPITALLGHRKRLALLALLAKAGSAGISREKLLAMLWPESATNQARNALNQVVHGLRRELGSDALIGGAEISLAPEVVACDCIEFRNAFAEGRYEDAVAFYSGRFLDGFYLKDAPDFERWADDTSRALAIDYTAALEQLAKNASSRGELRSAVQSLRRLSDADPLSARVARSLIEALVAAGDRENAISHGAAYTLLVRAELDAEPDAGISALLDQLRDDAGNAGPMPKIAPALASSASLVEDRSDTSGTSPVVAAVSRRSGRGWTIAAAVTLIGAASYVLLFGTRNGRSPTHATSLVQTAPPITAPAVVRSNVPVRAESSSAPATVQDSTVSDPQLVGVPAFESQPGDTALRRIARLAMDWTAEGVQQTGKTAIVGETARRSFEISGRVYRRGDSVAVAAKLIDARRGAVLAILRPIVAPTNDASSIEDQLRSRVAGAVATHFDAVFAETVDPSAGPPTHEAYLEYMAGVNLFRNFQGAKAQPHFAAAASLDSTFASALVWSALAWSTAGAVARRDSAIERLAARSASLAPLERDALDYLVAEQHEDRRAMTLAATAAATINPRSIWSYLAAQLELSRNQVREAVASFERVDAEHGWVRGWPPFWNAYMTAVHLAGDGKKEVAVARRAIDAGSEPINSRRHTIAGLILQRRPAEALREMDDLIRAARTGTPNVVSTPPPALMYDVALELRAHDMPSQAERVFTRAIDWCSSSGADDFVRAARDTSRIRSFVRGILVTLYYQTGRLDAADSLLASVDLARAPTLAPYRGLIAAKRGNRAQAEEAAASIDQLMSLTPGDRAFDQAWIFAVLGDRDRAMRQFEVSVSRMPHVFNAVHLLSDWRKLEPEIHALHADASRAAPRK